MTKPTHDQAYTRYLVDMQTAQWKRFLNVQAPYRWNIRRQNLGKTLDIGCGIGRMLVALNEGSIGTDPNKTTVEYVRSIGMEAYTQEELKETKYYKQDYFDSFLFAHVAEHLGVDTSVKVLSEYIHMLKPGGRLMILTPQDIAYGWDNTHVEFIDFEKLRDISDKLGFKEISAYSFPLPRVFGKFIPHIEFNYICQKNITVK